jgi:hypothetical protein
VLTYLRNDLTIPDFTSSWEKELFLKELEYWEIPDKKCMNDLKDLFDTVPMNSDVSPILL